MDLDSLPIFQALGKRAEHLNRRQEVVSSNIANANTPDYKAKKVESLDFDQAMQEPSAGMVRTDDNHLGGTRPVSDRADVRQAETREMAPDGNTVVLEEQMKKVSEIKVQHRMNQDLYKKNLQMMQRVIGGSGR